MNYCFFFLYEYISRFLQKELSKQSQEFLSMHEGLFL